MTTLIDLASKKQAEYQSLREQGMTVDAVAKHLGVHPRTVERSLAALRKKAAARGLAPEHDMTHTVPEGFHVKGVSTLYGEDGQVKGQWVKSQSDRERQAEMLVERLEQGSSSFKKFRPTKGPTTADENLLTLITITDYHLGMYAWEAETGADWDEGISRDVFLNAVNDLVDASPKSGMGLLNQLGDFLHWDGLLAVTPQSGHVLDADTRYGKLVDLAMEVMTEAVRIMLRKFPRVHVVQAEGNHDISGSVWIRKHIKHLFANEPRVTVDDTEFPYYAYLHGQTMLGFHHGHKMKLAKLPNLFASEPRYRPIWGKATQTYIHTGHYHSEKVIEDGGAIVEQHPTLAARDAYSARGGWVSNRGAKAITYDKTDGECKRVTVRPRVTI